MPLSTGTRLGPYEIVSPIGAGGMGEVYRARDTRLDRTVAIKVLPPLLAADPQFRERFEREAKSISALNHPNICTLHDVGKENGVDFLVMEFLEGETLAARLAGGPLPLPDVLKVAAEIAGALDAAHRRGIVHRDLKPGNVMLTRAGAKLLDFGLAKASGAPAVVASSGTMLPTTPASLTSQGTILGTFQYMAPEQVEGEEADARTDIFAFGVVLFEMLTGRKAFAGKTQASLLGAILKDQPSPVSAVQPAAPPALDHVVRTCLAKDPADRFQSAHDLLLQLRWIAEGGSVAGVPAPVLTRRRSQEKVAWAAAAVLGAVALGAGALAVVHVRETPARVEPVQFAISAEGNASLGLAQFAVSTDGRQLVFVAATAGGTPTLWVRPLATLTARVLPGTEGAAFPFWSPDGKEVGFFAGGKLKKVPAGGGPPVVLCDSAPGGGAAWSRDNVIVFASGTASPLLKVAAGGGIPAPVTELVNGDTGHRWPTVLPDGRHVIFLGATPRGRDLRLASLDSKDTTSLGESDSQALFADGHLLASRAGTLMAQPFDASARRKAGDPFPVAEQVPVGASGRLLAAVSDTGVLAYFRGGTQALSRLTWFDRAGKALNTVGELGPYFNLSLSPDERRVAIAVGGGQGRDIWVVDMARADTATRLTFDPATEADPIWSPDGAQVLFNSNRSGAYDSAFLRAADGGGQDVPVAKTDALFDCPDWSHDGRSIMFTGAGSQTNRDLWLLPLSGDRKPAIYFQTPFNEECPAFSPDDKWIAYNSDASGRYEVYVRSLAPGGGQFQISRNGGWAPRWRGDGKELFFLALDGGMMSADVTIAKDVQAAVPKALFQTPLLRGNDKHTYAVTKDGKRFLYPVPDQRQLSVPITVVLNWPGLVKRER